MSAVRIGASLFALFVVALGYGVLVPLAPEIAGRSMSGADARAISFHTGAMSFTYLSAFALLAPFSGRIVDMKRPRDIGVAGMAAFATAFAVLGYARGMWTIYGTLALSGAAASAVVPALQAQVRALASDAARARLLAAFGSASFAGWFLGPPLAAWTRTTAAASMIAWSFGLVAAMGLLASIFAWTALRDAGGIPRPATEDAREPPRAGGIRGWPLAAMAVTFGIGSFEVSILLWAVQVLRLDPPLVTRMLLECTLVMMAVQGGIFLLPGALPRFGPASASIAFGTMALALAMSPLHPAAWLAFAAVAVLAVSATLLQAMLAVHVVSGNGQRTGEVLGFQLALSNGGQALGSLSAGTLFSASGTSFFAASAVLAIVAVWSARSASAPRTP